MSTPDYSKYGKKELLEALSTIDESAYPERINIIKEELANRYTSEIKNEKSIQNFNLSQALEARDFFKYFEQGHIFLKIASFVTGISILCLMFGFSFLNEFGYELNIDFPGLSYIIEENNSIIKYIIGSGFCILFIIGSIASYFNKIYDKVLVIAWGLMSLGVWIWRFKWWPKLSMDYGIHIGITLQGIPLYFQLNILASCFLVWTIIQNPQLRREFLRQ